MKSLRGGNSRSIERPYFRLREIEEICASELRKVDLYPAEPGPVRIDRFIEKRFGVTHEYQDLPDGVLGFTRFGKNGVEAVIVARTLDEGGAKATERRLRATLAHESGHGLLHAHLFSLGEKPRSLFEDGDTTPRILCREVIGGPASSSRRRVNWSEFQANRAIGGLLMPRALVARALEEFCTSAGQLGHKVLKPDKRDSAIRALSTAFDVNPIVARIRLEEVFPLKNDAQLPL